MSKSVDDVLGLAPPLPKPDPPREDPGLTAWEAEVEREALESLTRTTQDVVVEAEAAQPVVSARRRLKQEVDERADDLATHAVEQALKVRGRHAVASVTKLINVADAPEAKLPTSVDAVYAMSFVELRAAAFAIDPERARAIEAEARA